MTLIGMDYTLPPESAQYYYVDANFRYGYRHLSLGTVHCYAALMSLYLTEFSNALANVFEALAHYSIGLSELVPGAGIFVAYFDERIYRQNIEIVYLEGETSYALGVDQGQRFKKEIAFAIRTFLPLFKAKLVANGIDPVDLAKEMEQHIAQDYLDEMQGIAEGAEVSYEEVLMANTIFDGADFFGCSLYGIAYDAEHQTFHREHATNYHHSEARTEENNLWESHERYDLLEDCGLSLEEEALKEALLKVNSEDTVQSIVFDTGSCNIALAVGGGDVAHQEYSTFLGTDLFGSQVAYPSQVKLARNLDWPLPHLGPQTKIFVRPAIAGKHATAIVGWPLLIGAFSGINEQGLALSIAIVPHKDHMRKTPNQLIFREILESSSTLESAKRVLASHQISSGMNLIVAAREGVALFELNPERS